MIVTGVFILLLLYESGQEEIQTNDIVSLQILTSQVVEILEGSEIDPPTMRPEDDPWIPLDMKGVVSLILVQNRRLWTCKGLNCHVKKVSQCKGE